MGQCLGVCTGSITAAEYRGQVIRPLATFLRGRKKYVIRTLEKRMKVYSQEKKFEEAARLRNQIASLERIHDIALLNKTFVEDQLKSQQSKNNISRIEGYDISNLGKTGKVGSMVVFDSEGPVKSQYRKFKIKTVEGQSDVDCLAEVLERRLNHDEWPLPDMLLVDGGKPQVNRAERILKERGFVIPLVGIAKGPDRKKNEFILGTKKKEMIHWIARNKMLLIRVRDEAHRFAIRYQRKLR
jgi:excinuclease ABC subunit C